jgi:hypothetical protein
MADVSVTLYRLRLPPRTHSDCSAVKRANAPAGISVMLLAVSCSPVVLDGKSDRSGKNAVATPRRSASHPSRAHARAIAHR